MSALLESLAAGFRALPAPLVQAHDLGAARHAALAEALATGLPGPRSEAWKYTSLRALSARSFIAGTAAPTVDAAALADIPAPRLVFVNGRFDPALSRLEALPEGVALEPLSRALAGTDARAVSVLARQFEAGDALFAHFNAALAVEGAWVRVAQGAQVATPLHLVFLGAPAGGDQALHLRHLVELRQDARLTVVEHHLGLGTHRHLANHLVHVHLARGAKLTHARVQDEDAGATLLARTDAGAGRRHRVPAGGPGAGGGPVAARTQHRPAG